MSHDTNTRGVESTKRRRFLKAVGALGVAGLAGCGGDGDEDTPTPTETDGNGNGNGNGNGTTETEEPDNVVFEITDLTVEPEGPIGSGETITVSAGITNTGSDAGTQTVEYRIDGDVQADQDLELEGFASGSVTFEEVDTSELEPGGSYEHGVYTEDDERTATLEIQELPDLTEPLLSIDGGTLNTGEVQLTGTWTNPYTFGVVHGEATLEVPDGWEIVEESGTTFDELDASGSQDVTWTLNVPDDTAGDHELTATVTYSDGVQDPVEHTVTSTINVFSEQEGQAFWTAADYDVEENPGDTWEPQNAVDTWEIGEDDDGKYLAVGGLDSERTHIRFTGAIQARTVEVRATLKATDSAADYWIYVRGSNEDDPEGLSMARADHILEYTQANRLSHYVAGEYDAIDAMDTVAEVGELYHVRARYEGDTFQGKWWLAGEDEPEEWQLEVDPGIDDPGFVGAGHWTGSPYHIYEYGVGIGGEEAP